MKAYLKLLTHVLVNGVDKSDRTGTGTRSEFGQQMRFDLNHSFPLVTTKLTSFRIIVQELLWFLRGDTNVKSLQAQNVHIWDEWADHHGYLGPIYGAQWRSWVGVDGKVHDQIKDVVHQLRTNPDSRRMIVSAWNVGDLDKMKLPPCHCLFQFYVADGKLSCQLYQRSADLFLGVPFNIASYALLTAMMAQVTGLKLGEFIWIGGDCHIYHNHFTQVNEQLCRKPFDAPQLILNKEVKEIDDFKFEDIQLQGYVHHPAIKAPVAV